MWSKTNFWGYFSQSFDFFFNSRIFLFDPPSDVFALWYTPRIVFVAALSLIPPVLLEAFPKTIGAQTLDYSSTGEINKLPVTFSYRWWKNLVDEGDLPVPVESVVTDGVSGVRRQILSNQPKTISKLGDNLNSKR